jgi:outer membrane protein OmpA-like peptidoglycan-associated protein
MTAQPTPPPTQTDHVPIYSVTVVERTVKAINYEYRTGPTKIDFRGTVLMPAGKGEATVEGQRGRTEIDAKFENVAAPTHYGREYLTYTLWAITPEGAPHNLGEVVVDGANKGHLHVTTNLQSFGLLVTAEPYSTTRQPSDVVVMENEVRPDTIGTIKPIEAKYELMPRGHYTWEIPQKMETAAAGLPKLSMDQYEAVLELYEAQNAIGVAQTAGAATYASSTFQEAQRLLQQAQQLRDTKAPSNLVVQNAREATQTAEDARTIAEHRRQAERIAAAEQAATQAQTDAANGLRQAQIQADAARAQAEEERAARQRAEAEVNELRSRADRAETAVAQAVASPAPPPPPQPAAQQKSELRMRLLEQLNGVGPTRDTPRGLVVTIGEPGFNGLALRDSSVGEIARLAAIVAQYSTLRVDVEGFTDEAATAGNTWRRAEAVQRILLERGLTSDRVTARGMGDAQLLASNASAAGRMQNRRVEIVISGSDIGNLPFWDRTYSLAPPRR